MKEAKKRNSNYQFMVNDYFSSNTHSKTLLPVNGPNNIVRRLLSHLENRQPRPRIMRQPKRREITPPRRDEQQENSDSSQSERRIFNKLENNKALASYKIKKRKVKIPKRRRITNESNVGSTTR